MLDRKEEYEKMARVEQEHWWYRALHHLVLDSLRGNTRNNDISILDAGCGTGGLMLFLRQEGYTRVRGFDLSPHAVEICRGRGLDVEQCDLRNVATRYPRASADVIISNDTLCFLNGEERSGFMRQCFDVLYPGGILILNVPALKAFAGIHDLSVGIQHRFSRSDLPSLINLNMFHLIRVLYWPLLLSPVVYCVRLQQRMKMRLTRNYEIRSDIDLPHPWVNRVLEGLTRFENRCLPLKPFGSSLYLVLESLPLAPCQTLLLCDNDAGCSQPGHFQR
jgi:SAM-dependent methyltransferase